MTTSSSTGRASMRGLAEVLVLPDELWILPFATLDVRHCRADLQPLITAVTCVRSPMPLASGTRLGSYEVIALIGMGGMGEVYRARDTKLGRDVALKILPDALAQDPERLVRFRREAHVLASLNHPHIATLHGLEDAGPFPALVMELVDGETVSDRIADGPLPVDEAIAIARQIGAALDAAHERGIVHRDLKPANVKVNADGAVKVLDFGLAKALGPADALDGADADAATVTSPVITGREVIIGTAAYMAPEQARGQRVDKRTDVWAFGCVLYEMVTGRRPFAGDNITDTIASVLKDRPDFSGVPAPMQRLIQRCLEKDQKRRLRDIADAWELLDVPGAQPAQTAPQGARRSFWIADRRSVDRPRRRARVVSEARDRVLPRRRPVRSRACRQQPH